MFVLGFLLLVSISYGEIFNLRKISNHSEIKNLLTTSFVGSGFLLTVLIIVAQTNNYSENLLVLKDWRMYFGVLLEILGVWLSRKNYEINKNSLTSINFSLFLSIILVPLFSFLLTDFFGFSDSINLNLSLLELLFFLVSYSILIWLYFYRKVNGEIKSKLLLVMLPISLSASIFWTTKMMQIYSGVIYYGIIGFSLTMFFLIKALIGKEYKFFKRSNLKDTYKIIIVSLLVLPMNIFVIKILAVEFVTIFKRIGQLLVALFLEKNRKVNILDKTIFIIVMFLTIAMYFSTKN